MKTLVIAMLMLAPALYAQGYTAGTITNAFAANEIVSTGVHIRTLQGQWSGFVGDLDEGHAEDYPIGFSFDYYGQSYTTIDICTNGWASFSGIAGSYPYLPTVPAANVPDAAYPNGEICVSYHNMFIYGMSSNGPDGIYAQTSGTAPNREFRIEWKTMRSMTAQGTTSVILILFETSNRIEIHFDSTLSLPPHATGLEDQNGTSGVASAGGWMQLGPQNNGFDFTPVAGSPEIGATLDGNAAADGAAIALGDSVDNLDRDVALALSNTGNAALMVGTVSITNAVNCSVAQVGAFPASIAAGGSESCTLRITPAGPGAYSFDVSVANDDADENPYDLAFAGNFTATGGGGGGGGNVGGVSGSGGGGSGCAASGVVDGLDLAMLLLLGIGAFALRARKA